MQAKRYSAVDVCTDTFVKRAPPRKVLQARIDEFLALVEKKGGRAAALAAWHAEHRKEKEQASNGGAGSASSASSKQKKTDKAKAKRAAKKSKKTRSKRRGSFDANDSEGTSPRERRATELAAERPIDEVKKDLRARPAAAVTSAPRRGREAASSGRGPAKRSSSTSRLPSSGSGARRQSRSKALFN